MAKIRVKYCTNNKVRECPSQIVFNSDDIICFKKNEKENICQCLENSSKS